MKKINVLLLLTALLLTASSCSKEKRVEHRLSSKGGKWTITKHTESLGIGFGSFASYGGVSNAGSMQFGKEGDFTWTQTYDGNTEVLTGTWTNNESDVNLVINGEKLVFRIEDGTRKEMRLTRTAIVTDQDGYQYPSVVTLQMEKE